MNAPVSPIGFHLVAVHLHGPLGAQFGERFDLAIKTPVEAIHALDANFPGFMNAFREHEHYAIFADGDWLSDEHVNLPVARELHFCPVIEGRVEIGALLVGALIPSIAHTAVATIIGGVLMTGLLLGVSLLMAPKTAKKDSSKDQNYSFSGTENVTTQGAPVPLIYGRVHATSVVISAGLELDVEYVASTPGTTTTVSPLARLTVAHPDLEPPPGGWPDIVDGKPVGWNFAVTQTVLIGAKDVATDIYLSPVNPQGVVYAWSALRGFFSFNAGTTSPIGDAA